ncbi:MAG: PEGA domain-containing protein [Elusimicrobiota bacterium]
MNKRISFLPLVLLFFTNVLLAEEKLNIAVTEFSGTNVSETEPASIADQIRYSLGKTNLFVVVDRGNMQKILNEQNFQNFSGCTDRECAVKMGRLLQVKKIITGRLSKLGTKYFLNIDVNDVETAAIDVSERIDTQSLEVMPDKIEELSARIANKLLGNKAVDTAKTPGIEDTVGYGSIKIVSNPPGADVVIDGEPIGKTPITVPKVPAGTRQVIISKDKYVSQQEKVNVIIGKTEEVNVELSQQMGLVVVKTIPLGAQVWCDGVYVGTATPMGLRIKKLALGEHTVKAEYGVEYFPQEQRVSVVFNSENEVVLQLREKPGAVYVESTPNGAKVYIDNKYYADTPRKIPDISAGVHTVKVLLNDYKEYTETTEVKGGKTVCITSTLEFDKRTIVSVNHGEEKSIAGISVTSTPKDAKVYIDDQYRATTPCIITDIPLGIHNIRVVRNGYGEFTKPVELKHGEILKVVADLGKATNVNDTAVTSSNNENKALKYDSQYIKTKRYVYYCSSVGKTFGILGSQPTTREEAIYKYTLSGLISGVVLGTLAYFAPPVKDDFTTYSTKEGNFLILTVAGVVSGFISGVSAKEIQQTSMLHLDKENDKIDYRFHMPQLVLNIADNTISTTFVSYKF